MIISFVKGAKLKGVTCDSREVQKGGLFVAVRGHDIDGHGFIGDAVRKGAKAIVAEKDFDCPGGVRKILVKDTRLAASAIAADFFGQPSKKLKMIGVTGTNGKTTITYLMESIIKENGKECGVIGTINYRLKGRLVPAKNTTPGPFELQPILAEMLKKGVRYAVMEVSSHSLEQHRVDDVWFDAAIFTNLTREHLDYHNTLESYFGAKASLFKKLKTKGTAVLNADDKKVLSLKRNMRNKVITYGVKKGAMVRAADIRLSLDGSRFMVDTPKGRIVIGTKLVGRHNVSNILAAIAAGIALGVKLSTIRKGIEAVSHVPGRLENVDVGQPFKVLVDYAHTDDALFNILSALRQVAGKRVITVFGCGGNRDRSKRPRMGKVACRFSDHVIVTTDNPRFEDPRAIIGEIEAGIAGKFSNYIIEPDRSAAIEKALNSAVEGDIVVIAGKGHENYQIVRDRVLSFDDRVVAMRVLSRMEACKR